ncbi:MAG TPA: hypothetical protein VIP98_24915 [Microlunatus sp.]
MADVLAPDRIWITGDGLAFVAAADDTFRRSLRRERSREADADDVRIEAGDFFDWARGAAAVAIRDYVVNDLPVT